MCGCNHGLCQGLGVSRVWPFHWQEDLTAQQSCKNRMTRKVDRPMGIQTIMLRREREREVIKTSEVPSCSVVSGAWWHGWLGTRRALGSRLRLGTLPVQSPVQSVHLDTCFPRAQPLVVHARGTASPTCLPATRRSCNLSQITASWWPCKALPVPVPLPLPLLLPA